MVFYLPNPLLGYEKVVHLLQEIRKTGVTKYINAINLGEIILIALAFQLLWGISTSGADRCV